MLKNLLKQVELSLGPACSPDLTPMDLKNYVYSHNAHFSVDDLKMKKEEQINYKIQ